MRAIFVPLLVVATACGGSAGPAGPKGDDGTSAPLAVGAGLSGDGSPAQPLSVAFGSSGTASSAARADHRHGAADLAAGALGAGVTLDGASVTGTVASAVHSTTADDAASLGGLPAASFLTTAAAASYVTITAADASYQPKGSYATVTDLASYARQTDLADYARLTDVAILDSNGRLAASVLPASVPVVEADGKLTAAVLPASVPLVGGNGKLPASVIPPLGADPAACTPANAGALRFTGVEFQGCDGARWLPFALVGAASGATPATAGSSCAAIHSVYPTVGDGVYWIDPDGFGGAAPFQAHCDMVTQGGGWTLVAAAGAGAGATSGLVVPSSDAYMNDERFGPLRAAASGFMALGPSSGTAFFASIAEAATGNCNAIGSAAPGSVGAFSLVYGHREQNGCDAQGGDYTILGIAGGGLFVVTNGAQPLWHEGSPAGPTAFGTVSPGDTKVELYVR